MGLKEWATRQRIFANVIRFQERIRINFLCGVSRKQQQHKRKEDLKKKLWRWKFLRRNAHPQPFPKDKRRLRTKFKRSPLRGEMERGILIRMNSSSRILRWKFFPN